MNKWGDTLEKLTDENEGVTASKMHKCMGSPKDGKEHSEEVGALGTSTEMSKVHVDIHQWWHSGGGPPPECGHYDLYWVNFTDDGDILIVGFPQTTDGVGNTLRCDISYDTGKNCRTFASSRWDLTRTIPSKWVMTLLWTVKGGKSHPLGGDHLT